MNAIRTAGLCAAALCALSACSEAGTKAAAIDPAAVEKEAHGGYLAAINSNNADTLMTMVTDDVVYQAPNEPQLAGRAAVKAWVQAYIDANTFKWVKSSVGFTVAGEWAFERYAYTVSNIDKKTGAVSADRGKGVNIFHHDADGRWRVAIDSWNSDVPAKR